MVGLEKKGFAWFAAGVVMTLALMLGVGAAYAAEGEEERPAFDVSVDFMSQYVSRGIAWSKDSLVIQPSATVSYKGFSLNVWGNFDTDEDEHGSKGDGANWNETDVTLAYERELFEHFTATVAIIYYEYDAIDNSVELMGAASYECPFITTTLTIYREVTHYPGWWITLDFSKEFALPYDLALTTGIKFGFMTLDDEDTTLDMEGREGDYSALHSGDLYTSLAIPVAKLFTITPKAGFSFPLSEKAADRIEAASYDHDETHLYGGVAISASF